MRGPRVTGMVSPHGTQWPNVSSFMAKIQLWNGREITDHWSSRNRLKSRDTKAVDFSAVFAVFAVCATSASASASAPAKM